ncbi:membrane protein [sediment metagenome]|uniref:Membrane protein n=1 Tax=sediment metagenome TaxID=749907 RepID=D9PL83_9ZZZZ
MVYALLKALHVLAVVLWVGGMAFAHFFLRPALATLEPPHRLRLMHVVLAASLLPCCGPWACCWPAGCG